MQSLDPPAPAFETHRASLVVQMVKLKEREATSKKTQRVSKNLEHTAVPCNKVRS